MLFRLLSALAAAASLAVASKCPPFYDLKDGGKCIRPLNLWVKGSLDTLLPQMSEQCGRDKATLPIIKSGQDQKMFNDIVASYPDIKDKSVFLVLGMVCNPSSHRLEWADHSAINYIQPPGNVNLNFDCVADAKHVVSRTWFNDWFVVDDDTTLYTYTFLCEAAPSDEDIDECGDYDVMSASKDWDKPCIKIFTDALSWRDAEAKCEKDGGALATINSDEENSYIRRSANGLGVVGGVHIGAQESPVGSDKWSWVDGTGPIDKSVYSNFIAPFPIQGRWSCGGMYTDSTAAPWIDVDCDNAKLPFVCRKQRK